MAAVPRNWRYIHEQLPNQQEQHAISGGDIKLNLPEQITVDGLTIHFTKYFIKLDQTDIHLTPSEFKLLSSLVKRLLSVFTQPTELQQLYEVVSTEYRRNPDAKMLPALAAIEQEIGQGGSLVPVLHQHLQHELGNLQTLTCAARYLSKESDTKTTLNELSLALGRLANTLPRFQCANCGYKLHEYVWRCPACHHWDSVQSQ